MRQRDIAVERRHLAVSTLITVTLICTSELFAGVALAADQHRATMAEGSMTIFGSLTESACRLEMSSLHQAVWLGNSDTATLRRPGDRAAPISFQLKLVDCGRGPKALRDSKSGNVSWSSMQPAVSVSFYGASDADTPDYLSVRGTRGLALALADSSGEELPLNQRATPLYLSPGKNTLTYTITPVRTPAPLRAGAWNASLDFRMVYD